MAVFWTVFASQPSAFGNSPRNEGVSRLKQSLDQLLNNWLLAVVLGPGASRRTACLLRCLRPLRKTRRLARSRRSPTCSIRWCDEAL
jgi:hypothetical protein